MEMTENMLDRLRSSLEGTMSAKRYKHTVEVENMVSRLAELYAPEKKQKLRAAALLHDITKEYSTEQHRKVCSDNGIAISELTESAPKTFHAMTAAALIPTLYPEFADGEIIGCVRWHTTARAGMTVPEALVYLADYIDMSRTFEDCVALRHYFWDAEPEKMSGEERLEHLRKTLILSLDMTIGALMEDGMTVSPDTFEARNSLILRGF